MGLLVDPRQGSDRLVSPLRDRGLAVDVEWLNSADVAWIGRGESGAPLRVGVEYKTIEEVLQCIQTGRFADEQLPKLQADYSQAWLLIEGAWKAGERGELLVHGWRMVDGKRRLGWHEPTLYGNRHHAWMYHEVEHWRMTMHHRGGVPSDSRPTLELCAEWLHGYYAWWTSKDLDEHKSDLKLFQTQPPGRRARFVTDTVRMAATIPGIGWEGAWAAAAKFKTVAQMVAAAPSDWEALMIGSKKQRRLGPKAAERVWAALHR